MGNENEGASKEESPAVTIKDVFKTDGILSKQLEGYEPRESQVRLAVAIDKSFTDGDNLAGEGPTGVGKSIAYLVPAILKAQSGRTVVATANIALQEQLVKKDLPFLQDVLPVEFDFALMKGRNNYLCKDSFESNSNAQFGFDRDAEGVSEILRWGKETSTGDKSELQVEPPHQVWSKFSVTSDECVGEVCPHKAECFANKAREELNSADIVVCNYHLLFAHVKVKAETTKDLVLPEFTYLVLDEAHKTADIARSFFGWDISEFAVNLLLKKFKDAYRAADKADMLEDGKLSEYQGIDNKVFGMISSVWSGGVHFHGETQGAKRMKKKGTINCVGLANALFDMSGGFKDFARLDNVDKKVKAKLEKASKRARELSEQLEELQALDGVDSVYFTERTGKKKLVRFCKRKINVANDLWEFFSGVDSVIATSATLAVEGSCRYVRNEMGLRESREIILPSPFDYKKQAVMVLSPRAPDPQVEGHTEKVCKVLEFVIKEAQGRTLCLFTSIKAMRMAKEYLDAHNPNGYTILCQGDSPRMKLVDDFKSDTSSVLLGTESFWAGVDVPGEALSCLVIDKLPFKSPADPVWSAICDQAGDEWFFKHAIPQAVIQMKQGIGRLIRKMTDKGVVIVLDRRLSTKNYGSTFVKSFPPMKRVNTLKGTIKEFLGKE